jgi:hypothetical protein
MSTTGVAVSAVAFVGAGGAASCASEGAALAQAIAAANTAVLADMPGTPEK